MAGRRGSDGAARQHSCGCMTGMLSMIATIGWYIATGAEAGHHAVARVAIGAAYALTAAVIGKFVGMGWSVVRPGRSRDATQGPLTRA
jgi:hypothetical protein